MFLLLHYLKVYPPQEYINMCILGKEVNTDRLIGIPSVVFFITFEIDALAERAEFLSGKINLIQRFWHNRFSEDNMIPPIFGTMVTGILDTAVMTRTKSVFHAVKKRSYNGKYKEHVMKLQVICDLRGRVIWISGPHPGSDHDLVVWCYENPIEMMHPQESFLADKAYIGQATITGSFLFFIFTLNVFRPIQEASWKAPQRVQKVLELHSWFLSRYSRALHRIRPRLWFFTTEAPGSHWDNRQVNKSLSKVHEVNFRGIQSTLCSAE